MARLEQAPPELIGYVDPVQANRVIFDGAEGRDPEEPLDLGFKVDSFHKQRIDEVILKTSSGGRSTLDPSSSLWHLDPNIKQAFGAATSNPTEFVVGSFPEGMTLAKLVEASETRPNVLDRYVKVCIALGHLSVHQPEPGQIYKIRGHAVHRFNPDGGKKPDGNFEDRAYMYGVIRDKPIKT